MRLLCWLGFHRPRDARIKSYSYFTATSVERRCARRGCQHVTTELWWGGRKL